MPESRAELLTRAFYAWERRGRAWDLYPYQVELEPPFRPFEGHVLPAAPLDDARRPSPVAKFFGLSAGRTPSPPEPENIEEPDPEPFAPNLPLVELALALPPGSAVPRGAVENLLLALGGLELPVTFELVGIPGSLSLQFAARLPDAGLLREQVEAFFPDLTVTESPVTLAESFAGACGPTLALECGLGAEFMLPLEVPRSLDPDPLIPLAAILGSLEPREAGVFQVLFEPVRSPWAPSVLHAVSDGAGGSFFADAPDFPKYAREKVSRPLFAAAVRFAVRAEGDRGWSLLRALYASLAQFEGQNGFLPLAAPEGFDLPGDVLARLTHRPGMLLSLPELASLVHPPAPSLEHPRLRRHALRTKAAPEIAGGDGVLLGVNPHRGRERAVRLPEAVRLRHTYVLGATGTGKSTLLANLILEDVRRGAGVGLIDPHGDLVEEILGRLPGERLADVTLFDPSDASFAVGWNVLGARTETEKNLLASDLVGVFRRLSTSWGDQMTAVLANAVLAFLEAPGGGTLLELRRFLVDPAYRAEVVRSLPDPEMRFFFEREFPLLQGGKSLGSILTRLDAFLRPRQVRAVVSVRDSPLDFRRLVDSGGIFLAKISEGALGEENAALLGSLLVSTFHQVTLGREGIRPGERRPFFLYLDEFHRFATPSMAALFSGARKYALSLTVAHQDLYQLEARESEVARSALANAATRVIFRVGEEDARKLAAGFGSFEARDLVNLGVGEAVVRIDGAESDFNLRTSPLPEISEEEAALRRERVREAMRSRFPRAKEAPPPEPETEAKTAGAEEPPEAPPVQEASREPVRPQEEKAVPKETPPKTVPPLGRGGAEHRYLQELVKRWGEARGFRSVIEEPIPGGQVDVALRREDRSIACEISVTTGSGQELGNVKKCLAAGFDEVVVLTAKASASAKLRAVLQERLGENERGRVRVLSPEEFFDTLTGEVTPETRTVGGYRVKVRYEGKGAGETAEKARSVSEVIAKSLRRLKGEKP